MTLPSDFSRMVYDTFGAAEAEQLLASLALPPSTSVRFNTRKTPDGQPQPDHQWGADIALQPVGWCADGAYLSGRPSFTDDPLFHAGCYYVQEAASMFLHTVMRQYADRPALMLDLCAAPGGKSTLALSALPEGSMLVSNDPVRRRANILLENLQKWGLPDVVVTQNTPEDFSRTGVKFDIVLCDAPCSGEGMFRKEPVAVEQWSADYVRECAQRQRDILVHAWQCLRPGGLLIYSTCTINTLENEENIRWLLSKEEGTTLPVSVDADWHIGGAAPGYAPMHAYRFLPHRTRGEGLFMAVVRKGDDGEGKRPTKPNAKRPLPRVSSAVAAAIRPWLLHGSDFFYTPQGDHIHAVRRQWQPTVEALCPRLHTLGMGIAMASVRGNTLIPHTALALSTEFNAASFPTQAVDTAQALCYLHGDSLQLPPDAPKGHVAIIYKGVALGFVKNLGTRANNLYPAPWRIKKNVNSLIDNQ